MSLINNYPEIKAFFKKNLFDNNELDKFIEFIENKYITDRTLKNSALSLIKLEVIKYEIQLDEHLEEPNKEEDEKSLNRLYLNDYKIHNINSLSNNFKVSPDLIIELLRQREVTKTKTDYLNENEYFLLEDFFKSKIKALERESKQQKKIFTPRHKKFQKSLYKGIPVYNKISQNSGIGKLIYIRKK